MIYSTRQQMQNDGPFPIRHHVNEKIHKKSNVVPILWKKMAYPGFCQQGANYCFHTFCVTYWHWNWNWFLVFNMNFVIHDHSYIIKQCPAKVFGWRQASYGKPLLKGRCAKCQIAVEILINSLENWHICSQNVQLRSYFFRILYSQAFGW